MKQQAAADSASVFELRPNYTRLFGFVMLITLGQWAAQKKWVNY